MRSGISWFERGIGILLTNERVCLWILFVFVWQAILTTNVFLTFTELEDEEESEGSFSSPPDSESVASDRYDKEDEAPSDGM